MPDETLRAALSLALDGSRGPGLFETKTDAALAKKVAKAAKASEAQGLAAVQRARPILVAAERIANALRDGKHPGPEAAQLALRQAAPGLDEDVYQRLLAAALRWSAF